MYFLVSLGAEESVNGSTYKAEVPYMNCRMIFFTLDNLKNHRIKAYYSYIKISYVGTKRFRY